MNREDPLTSAQLHEKVNLNKLKEQLEAQGLPFAFKETKEGTNFYFRVKDTELAKKALERVLTDIKKNPQMILRKPNTMTFDERLAYTATNKNTWVKLIKQKQSQKEGNCNADVQKELKPYLYLGVFLFVIGFGIGNFFWLLPGQTIFQNELSLYKRYSNVYRTNFYRFYNTKSIRI